MSSDRNVSFVTTMLGVIAALLVVSTLGIFLQGWALRRMAEEESRKIFQRPYPELEAYTAEQEQLLSAGYHWLDEDAGRVHLPIERAMALVVAEQAAAQPTTEPDAAVETSAESSAESSVESPSASQAAGEEQEACR